MIGRTVLLKVGIFLLVTLLGVSYMLVNYLGVGASFFHKQYTVSLDLAESGGIFDGAEVTYRGVSVGRVGTIALRDDGIRVNLDLETDEKIPSELRAVVANGSAVGEQYVDLQPKTTKGPYLDNGSVIAQADTALPIPTNTLLRSLDDLVNSIPKDDLATLVEEAGKAFADRGPDLQRLIDSSQPLIQEATAALPQTTTLITDAQTLLATQRAQGSSLQTFSKNLALLSGQFVKSDGDLRTVLEDAGPAGSELNKTITAVRPGLTALLADLTDISTVVQKRSNSLRQLLIYYPYLVAVSFTIFPGDGTTKFGVPTNQAGQAACREGYDPASLARDPQNRETPPFNFDKFCKAPKDSGIAVRGPRNAPPPAGDGPTKQRR